MINWIESLELAAEISLDEMTEGLPPGKFLCGCGQIGDLAHAATGVRIVVLPAQLHTHLSNRLQEQAFQVSY